MKALLGMYTYVCIIENIRFFVHNLLNRCQNSEMLNEYDLINEYRNIFLKLVNEYWGKPPSMEENRLHYLNEYTRLIGT